MPVPVDVCVLLYGDYPDLARRCLVSLDGLLDDPDTNLVVAMNEPSSRTLSLLPTVLPNRPDRITFTLSDPQIHKYPMMRFVLGTPTLRPGGIFCWFDDDSFVKTDPRLMVRDLRLDLAGTDPTVVGAKYTYNRLEPYQVDWARRQWWYTGQPIQAQKTPFLTGSWWACHTSLLRKYDWPDPVIDHNGGDILFGLLCDQQGIRMVDSHKHVSINADSSGRDCSQPTRGFKGRRAGDPNAPPPPRPVDMGDVRLEPGEHS